MVCKLYDNGECIGLKMFSEGIVHLQGGKIEDRNVNRREYCIDGDGIRGDDKCSFLAWYEDNIENDSEDFLPETENKSDSGRSKNVNLTLEEKTALGSI